jgi:hypothetical protein
MKRSPLKRGKPLRKRGESAADALWRDARNATLERDHYECQAQLRGFPGECNGHLEVHHILPRSRGGQHHPANLLTLCYWHHQDVHHRPTTSYKLGLLQRSGDTECANCHHRARFHSVTYGSCTYGVFGMECPCLGFIEEAA